MRWLPTLLVLAACAGGGGTEDPAAVAPVDSASPSAVTESNAAVDVTTPVTGAPAVQPAGFDRTAALVTMDDGSTCELCVWLATSQTDRARGLMEVTDLGAADAMAFVYPEAHTASFWMKNTVMPLSIAFYSPAGEFLDAFDMDPCVTEQCGSYPTPVDFLIAVEAPKGGLVDLGLVAGSTLELLDSPCTD